VIKDSDGNDVRVFVKEDKKRGLRRDSSFYWNGSWEVFEMKGETETTLRNSLGITTSSIRDNEGKLQVRILKDKDGNFVINDKYIWKNGLLIKEIGIEGTRVYLYGKNPYEDTVRVIPSDNGHYFHKGYDGSVGMIPKKGDVNYENYLANPYGIWLVFSNNIFKKESGFNALMKGGYNSVTTPVSGMPIPNYKNTPWSDTLKLECRQSGRCLPIPYNGRSHLKPAFTDDQCSCYDGRYSIEYGIKLLNPTIEILQSFIVLDMESIIQGKGKKWVRMCLTAKEIQEIYNHEVKHHMNALNKMQELTNKYMPKDKYETFEKCKEVGSKASEIITHYMDEWLINEKNHLNKESPKDTWLKQGEKCYE
ncbi:MAG: hypothetical protein LBC87_11045, partial [Fibromonadaceae bacterium]|nr:hypothetical protein [Fibromonadaceae bacterium]